MKIIGIGQNYQDHIKEMSGKIPTEPVVFFKPETALLLKNAPFYYPNFSTDIHFEAELVVRINQEGKNIEEHFANKYYDEIGVGIDFTARDLQRKAKENGLPWALAKGFNGSAPISSFVKKNKQDLLSGYTFSLKQNGEVKQLGNSAQMIFTIDQLIAYTSKFIMLKKGDLIFTGTPAGVGAVAIGDLLEVFLGEEKMLSCEIK